MIFLLSIVDRTNIGNARIAGLQTDLKMTDRQFSTALTVTFIPYILVELPSNLVLKVVGTNRMLPTLLTLWGVVTTIQGTVTSYKGLLACRFFLGLLEGGLGPAIVLYFSCFYPRHKLNLRITLVFSTAGLAGAFSGLLAYGIINMDGLSHVHGWAWIFILEGLFTVLFGLCTFFLLPGSLQDCSFLGETEKAYALKQLRDTRAIGNREDDRFCWGEVKRAFMSLHILLLNAASFFSGAKFYGFA